MTYIVMALVLYVVAPLLKSRNAAQETNSQAANTLAKLMSQELEAREKDQAERREILEERKRADELDRAAQAKFIETLGAMKQSIDNSAAQAASAILPEVTNLQHQLDERAKTNADLARENAKLILETTSELKAFRAEFGALLEKLSPMIRQELSPIMDKLQPIMDSVEASGKIVTELRNEITDMHHAVIDAITRLATPAPVVAVTPVQPTNTLTVTVAPPTVETAPVNDAKPIDAPKPDEPKIKEQGGGV